VVAHEYQPAKVAAMEGWWETRAGQPSILFALPDQEGERNRMEVAIPRIGSWVVAGDINAELQGLDAFAPEDRPPVAWVFWAFRIMVGLGLAMIAIGLWGAWLWLRRGLEKSRLFQLATVPMALSGFVAVLAGWISAEVGRQPYVVYGLLRTVDAVSPVAGGQVAASLLVFMIVYAIVFTAGSLYILRLIAKGPGSGELPPERGHRAPGSLLASVTGDTEPGRAVP
jgi:cytochrome d ubiquinol oxidase subunit I